MVEGTEFTPPSEHSEPSPATLFRSIADSLKKLGTEQQLPICQRALHVPQANGGDAFISDQLTGRHKDYPVVDMSVPLKDRKPIVIDQTTLNTLENGAFITIDINRPPSQSPKPDVRQVYFIGNPSAYENTQYGRAIRQKNTDTGELLDYPTKPTIYYFGESDIVEVVTPETHPALFAELTTIAEAFATQVGPAPTEK